MAEKSATTNSEDDPLAWSPKHRTEIEWGFYLAAVPFFGLTAWLASTGSTHSWIALLPAVGLVGLGVLARWITKPEKRSDPTR